MRIAVALTAALLLGAAVDSAAAGTYDVWGCRLADGTVAPLDGWRHDGGGFGANQCPSFGFSAGFPNSAIAATATSGWTFEAPPDLTIAGYELYRAARVGQGADGTSRAFALYHDFPLFDPLVRLFEFCAPCVGGCYEVGIPYPGDPMDPANRVARSDLNVKNLILRMECRSYDGAPHDCGPADPAGTFGVARSRITLNDGMPPRLSTPEGPIMTDGAVVEGMQAITVTTEDSGGGVERIAVLVDGRPELVETVESEAPHCRRPFVNVVPCAPATKRTLAFDTARVANGSHAIEIAVDDAAGNRTLSRAVQVTTINGAVPNGSGASRRAHLEAAFATHGRRSAPERATVGFRKTRRIKGRLTDADGAPIGSAGLEVTAQALRPGARVRREATIETGPDGRFGYVTRRGPSRIIRLGYRAFSLDEAPSAVATLTLEVRAGIRLAVTPRRTTARGTIRFAGRLLGGPGRHGVQVALYAVGRVGRQRVPVAVLQTDMRGRFRFRYRFVRTFAPYTYRFQARVEAQPTYPYVAGASNQAVVRVVR